MVNCTHRPLSPTHTSSAYVALSHNSSVGSTHKILSRSALHAAVPSRGRESHVRLYNDRSKLTGGEHPSKQTCVRGCLPSYSSFSIVSQVGILGGTVFKHCSNVFGFEPFFFFRPFIQLNVFIEAIHEVMILTSHTSKSREVIINTCKVATLPKLTFVVIF